MREIKFRAWHKQTGIMFPVQDIQITDRLHVCSAGDDDSYVMGFVGEHVELMQFTGLKDRNNVEIYEGDIVRWHVNGVTREGIVEYWAEWGCFDLKNFNDEFHVCNDWGRGEYEVLGNIHTNPDLSEVPK